MYVDETNYICYTYMGYKVHFCFDYTSLYSMKLGVQKPINTTSALSSLPTIYLYYYLLYNDTHGPGFYDVVVAQKVVTFRKVIPINMLLKFWYLMSGVCEGAVPCLLHQREPLQGSNNSHWLWFLKGLEAFLECLLRLFSKQSPHIPLPFLNTYFFYWLHISHSPMPDLNQREFLKWSWVFHLFKRWEILRPHGTVSLALIIAGWSMVSPQTDGTDCIWTMIKCQLLRGIFVSVAVPFQTWYILSFFPKCVPGEPPVCNVIEFWEG